MYAVRKFLLWQGLPWQLRPATPCACTTTPAPQGGRAGLGKGAAVLQDVEIFDPQSNSWLAAPPMAAPRTSHAAAPLGGRLFAVGGQDSRSTHATCEVFDPAAERWVTLGARLQLPRKYLGLAAAAGGVGWGGVGVGWVGWVLVRESAGSSSLC